MSAELLRHISYQLANSSFPAAPNSSQFQAQRSDVRVNVCWFVSLLLSLVVALFGIFLKQWMRTYIKWTDITPDREAVALRQFRYRGLETWRLGAILALLPTLLQLSVILFLSGLLIFLWNLDPMVAYVMAVLLTIAFFSCCLCHRPSCCVTVMPLPVPIVGDYSGYILARVVLWQDSSNCCRHLHGVRMDILPKRLEVPC
jgi:hypothetical protein